MSALDFSGDVTRIRVVCGIYGVKITPAQAQRAWEDYSCDLSAGWMVLPEDDNVLFATVERYLPGGAFVRTDRECEKCHGNRALPEMNWCRACTRELLVWLQQTIHRAHHSGPLEGCRKNTCDAIQKAIGTRDDTGKSL